MLTIHNGRVEMDPMRVPAATSMARNDSFEQVLQQTVAAEEPAAVAEPTPREEPVKAEEAELAADAPAQDVAQGHEDPVEAADDNSITEPTVHGQATAAEADTTDSIRRGGSARQETAGKGTDSSRPSSRDIEPLLAAVVQHTATPNAPVVAGVNTNGITGVGGVSTGGTAPTRGLDGTAQRGNTPLPSPSVQGSYKTTSKESAELLEQSRDSVFKQVLLRLSGEGGEMRMRLDPPELGELDLRLVLEGGNKLSLAIAAERPDVAHLLQKHLDELQQTLRSAGLLVTGAEVQTRSEFARQSKQQDQSARDGMPSSPKPETETAPIRMTRTVVAEGLDFWA